MAIADIIIRGEVSQYLAVNYITRSGLNGGGTPAHLPELIYQITENVKWMYAKDPNYSTLLGVANYLYAITGKFGLQASYLVNTGGTIAGVGSGVVGFKAPLIGVAGDGGGDDPIVGLNTYQNDKLKNLGASNNGRIQVFMLKIAMDNFEPTPDFSYNPVTGVLSDLPFVWEVGNTIYADLNQ